MSDDGPTLVFFDDYPLHSENQLFMKVLRRKLSGGRIHIEVQKTFRGIEACLRTLPATVVVLDVMAQAPMGRGEALGVESALAGLEVLRRCRGGAYGALNQDVPVFMRSARGEQNVRRLCLEAGANGYYLVGTGDENLVNEIGRLVEDVLV